MATMAAAMFSRWQRQECAVDNSKRAGGGRRRRRTQGQGGGNVYAWWAGGGQHDKRGGRRGRGEASRKRATQQEGGGVRRREASRRRTTQQEGCHCGGKRWWNPPMRVAANVDAVGCQSPSRQEKEGRGPLTHISASNIRQTTAYWGSPEMS